MGHDQRTRNPTINILVVEDAKINQEILETILRDANYMVTVVADGFAAVEALRIGEFDLVLMDLHMPGMGGIEAAHLIRRIDGKARHVPIVAITGNISWEDTERCKVAGMNDYLMKPVDKWLLLQVIERWTGHGEAL